MQFCTQCGHQLENKMKFCTECGTAVKNKNEQQTDTQTKKQTVGPIQQKRQSIPKKKPLSKKSKIIIGIVSIIGILLFSTYKFVSMQYDPIKTLQQMDQAIADNNVDDFNTHFSFNDKAILSDKAFFNYVKEHEWDYNLKQELLNYFEYESQHSSGLDYNVNSNYGDKFIVIREKPVLLGLFKTYEFQVEPSTLYVSTNVDDTELTILGETIELTPDESEVKLLIYPGELKLEGQAQNEFGKFKYNNETVFHAVKEAQYTVEFEAEEFYLDTGYDYQDAIVFIDGKSTEKTIADSDYLAPVPKKSKTKVHTEWESDSGNTLKSDTYVLGKLDGNRIYFEFDESKVIAADAKHLDDEDAGKFVLDFRDAYENAVNYADYSEIKNYLEPDGHAAKDLKKYIKDLEDTYYRYNFTENIVTNIKKVEDDIIEVTTNELFTFTNHKYDVLDYDREKKYTVVIKDDQYLIRKIDYLETKHDKK